MLPRRLGRPVLLSGSPPPHSLRLIHHTHTRGTGCPDPSNPRIRSGPPDPICSPDPDHATSPVHTLLHRACKSRKHWTKGHGMRLDSRPTGLKSPTTGLLIQPFPLGQAYRPELDALHPPCPKLWTESPPRIVPELSDLPATAHPGGVSRTHPNRTCTGCQPTPETSHKVLIVHGPDPRSPDPDPRSPDPCHLPLPAQPLPRPRSARRRLHPARPRRLLGPHGRPAPPRRPEARYGESRIDFLLTSPSLPPACWRSSRSRPPFPTRMGPEWHASPTPRPSGAPATSRSSPAPSRTATVPPCSSWCSARMPTPSAPTMRSTPRSARRCGRPGTRGGALRLVHGPRPRSPGAGRSPSRQADAAMTPHQMPEGARRTVGALHNAYPAGSFRKGG